MKKFLLFTIGKDPKTLPLLLLYTLAGGFGQAASVHYIFGGLGHQENPALTLAFFLLSLLLHEWGRQSFLKAGIRLVYSALKKTRLLVAEKILSLPVSGFESFQKDKEAEQVFQEISKMEYAAHHVSSFVERLLFVFAYVCYIAYLDWSLSFFIIPVLPIGYLLMQWMSMRHARQKEDERALFNDKRERLFNLLLGIKTNRASSSKNNTAWSAYSRSVEAYHRAGKNNTATSFIWRNRPQILFLAINVLMVLFALLFVENSDAQMRLRIGASILFLLKSAVNVFSIAPNVFSFAASAYIMEQSMPDIFQNTLRKEDKTGDIVGTIDVPFEKKLTYSGLSYRYCKGQTGGFTVGPIDLEIKKGESLFVVGSNGSGKTTLIKLLAGLYEADQGHISVDGQVIKQQNMASYQELFSLLMADFYSFTAPYGIEKVPKAKVEKLLKLLQLEEAVSFDENGFSTNRLSTGQRKRLALLWGFLEDKQIYIYDEAGADQDPENRRKFYEFILPDMKKAGKTIIAVTHDEHFFHLADRLLEMKNGKLFEIKSNGNE